MIKISVDEIFVVACIYFSIVCCFGIGAKEMPANFFTISIMVLPYILLPIFHLRLKQRYGKFVEDMSKKMQNFMKELGQ